MINPLNITPSKIIEPDLNFDALINRAMKTPYFHLEDYMERYWLTPFNPNGMNIRVHKILSSDSDRHMHDHPWPSTSIILKQGYWEWLPNDQS